MELGQRLKQARLEAGLSQRQLCGQEITRNMLSQIENGSARPSMDTLRYLASRLGKPMGYFLEEQAVTSPNQDVMAKARQAYAQGEDPLKILKEYREPDEVFDPEYHLLAALSRMALAKQAIDDGRAAYAWTLLEEAATHGKATPYYTSDHERARLLLCYEARPDQASGLAGQLPSNLTEILLRADAEPSAAQKGRILDAAPQDDPRWHQKRADAYFREQNYAKAIIHYEKAPQTRLVFEKLEICCKELEDYKGAYFYAVKARES